MNSQGDMNSNALDAEIARLIDSKSTEISSGWFQALKQEWCGEMCPLLPGVPNQEWSVPDPAGKPVEIMRKIRDEIEERVGRLVTALD